MIYTYNRTRHRIDIVSENGVVVAFITEEYFKHYPYFDRLNDDEPF